MVATSSIQNCGQYVALPVSPDFSLVTIVRKNACVGFARYTCAASTIYTEMVAEFNLAQFEVDVTAATVIQAGSRGELQRWQAIRDVTFVCDFICHKAQRFHTASPSSPACSMDTLSGSVEQRTNCYKQSQDHGLCVFVMIFYLVYRSSLSRMGGLLGATCLGQ